MNVKFLLRVLTVVLFSSFVSVLGQDEYRLCGDSQCTKRISQAKVLISQYNKINDGGANLGRNDLVYIVSKPTTEKNGYFEVEVIDKETNQLKSRGMAAQSFLREEKKFINNKDLIKVKRSKEAEKASSSVINTTPQSGVSESLEIKSTSPLVSDSSQQFVGGGVMAEIGDGGPPSTPYQVMEGTTIFHGIDGDDTISATSTAPPTLNTDTPDSVIRATENPLNDENKDTVDEENEQDDEGDDNEDGEEEEEEEESDSEEDPPNSNDVRVQDEQKQKLSMDELAKQIELASFEPGSNPALDELLLSKIKLSPTDSTDGESGRDQHIPSLVNVPPTEKAETSTPAADINNNVETSSTEVPAANMAGPLSVEKLVVSTVQSTDEASVSTVQSTDEASVSTVQSTDEASGASTEKQVDEISVEATVKPGDTFSAESRVAAATDSVGNVNNALPDRDVVSDPMLHKNEPNVEENESVSALQNDSFVDESQDTVNPPEVGENELSLNETQDTLPVIGVNETHDTVNGTEVNETDDTTKEAEVNETHDMLNGTESNETHDMANGTEDNETHDTVNGTETAENTVHEENEPQNVLIDPVGVPSSAIPTDSLQNTYYLGNDQMVDETRTATDIPTSGESALPADHIEPSVNITESQEDVPAELNMVAKIDAAAPSDSSYTPGTLDSQPEAPSVESHHIRQPPMYPGLLPSARKSDAIAEESTRQEGFGSIEEITRDDQRQAGQSQTLEENPAQEGVGSVEEIKPSLGDEATVTPPPEISQVPEGSNEINEEKEGDSGFFNFFGGWFGSSSTAEPSESAEPPSITLTHSHLDADGLNGECKDLKGLETDCADAPGPAHLWHVFEKTVPEKSYSLLYLIVTSITLLIFTLGYYFIENSRQNAPLVAKINELTHDLQISKSQLAGRPLFETTDNTELLSSINAELAEIKKRNVDLQQQVDTLQNELDSSADAGMELNNMVADLLAEKQSANALIQSVENLQGQLNTQQQVIDDMNRSLLEKIEEKKVLEGELAAALEDLNSVQESLNQQVAEKENSSWELENKLEELEVQNKKLLADVAAIDKSKAAEVEALSRSVAEMQEQLRLRESEYSALQETVEDLKKGGADAAAIYDVGHAKAQLSRVLSENNNLQERLNDEEGARKLLEDHVKSVDEEVSRLRSAFAAAEKDKVDAETKLVVLSNYWKEKETHFQKELGLQEVMWAQKQGDEASTFERIKSLQDEVDSYKSQNDMLKKEIMDQERGLKSQIATLEKKAHENWVAARQAERRLDESKQEAGQLRNMLTLIEKSTTGDVSTGPTTRELNGDELPLPPLLPDGTSPLHMPPPMDPLGGPPPLLPPNFMPPFMPPPLLPPPPHLLPGDRRLPPLGRMSSPPLNRFSPGPGDYSFDRMSPTVLSPAARNYRSPATNRSSPWDELPHRSGFRPVPSHRDRRDYQDSNASSGHSSEESLDKHQSSRRGKV